MPQVGERALVLGASMGGLLAARVLAEHYRTVTVVDRDVLSDGAVQRRGVPQGRHAHVLLAGCSQILDDLFPGVLDELVGEGVAASHDGDLSRWWLSIGGHRVVPSGTVANPESMPIYYPSRPLLESTVRRRVRAIPNVEILDGHDVAALTATADRARVTGAQLVCHNGGARVAVAADLVVDATGRGSRAPVFLTELGYRRPREDEVAVELAYASQPLRIAAGILREDLFAIFPEPGRPTTFALLGNENDTWLLTMGSMAGRQPPRDRAEMIALAADFAPPHAVAAVRAAEPLGQVAHYRVPSNRWRRYDKMSRTPEGLLVFGDAICSFNPIYGQGMTVAAIEATILRDCLRRGQPHLPARFYRAAAKTLRVAWHTAVGSDLALPEVAGPRPAAMRMTNAYLDRVLNAVETDPVVAIQFLRVTGMIDSPLRLLRPTVLWRVARAGRGRPAAAPNAEPAAAAGSATTRR